MDGENKGKTSIKMGWFWGNKPYFWIFLETSKRLLQIQVIWAMISSLLLYGDEKTTPLYSGIIS